MTDWAHSRDEPRDLAGRVARHDSHGRVETTQPHAQRPETWWRDAVVYQIYPRSFADSNGDGVGDLRGVLARLDHLSELGVDVVWLSPVYRSPQDDNGYDISDYCDIDPLFGTLADLDELIAELHARGMKLMMDLVVNHTSDEHPWFVESRNPASPKRDWYWWAPPRPGREPGTPGAEPTNWGSAFSGPAWEFDPDSGEYYMHMFSRKQPDLNWENPQVRQAVYAMMRWWLDRGVDGFRMDVINLISKPAEIVDGPAPKGQLYPSFQAVANGPRLDEFLAEMNREVGLSARGAMTVGEMPGATVEVASRVTAPERNELNMVFTFEHVELDQIRGGAKWDLAPLPLPVLKQNLASWQHGLAGRGWNSLYWSNHDQPRPVSRFGDDSPRHRAASAKTLGTILHLHQGTPYVYQGEELGLTNAGFTRIEQYEDLESLRFFAEAKANGADEASLLRSLAAKGRDNARTPMPWDDGDHHGFSATTPWLEQPPPAATAAEARADEDSVFHHYRRLIELRHSNPVVVYGDFELLLPAHDRLWAFTRTLGDERLLVLANCSSTPLELPDEVRGLAAGQLVLGTHPAATAAVLAPWESRILR